MSSFGKRLRYLRDLNNLTQKEMGALLGVGPAYISQLENGREQPSEQLILLLSKQFYVREEWLRDGKHPMAVSMEQLMEPVLKAIAEQGQPARLGLQMILAKAKLYSEMESNLAKVEDAELLAMIGYLKWVWTRGGEDPDIRAWLKVQFRKAFPDFQEYIKKDDAASMA